MAKVHYWNKDGETHLIHSIDDQRLASADDQIEYDSETQTLTVVYQTTDQYTGLKTRNVRHISGVIEVWIEQEASDG